MNIRFRHAAAALIAAGAFPFAQAASYVSEPTASAFANQGPDAELASTIAQALNEDSSLKGTKISVVVDETGSIVLVGAAPTIVEAQRAAEIAARAGSDAQRLVVNAILTDRIQTSGAAPATAG